MKKGLIASILAVTMVGALIAGCGTKAPTKTEGTDTTTPTKVEKPTITVSSKEFTEQLILGNMMALLLEKNGFPVNRKIGLTGTAVVAKALESGDIDVYAEYTGTGLVTILKQPVITDPDEAYAAVKKGYETQFNEEWLGRLGINNTYVLTMKADKAKELGILTLSDLVTKGADLKFGSDQEFLARPDGYPALSKAYGFEFKQANIKSMDAGLVYQAVDSGQVDIIMGFATDGRIKKLNLMNLKDDKNFFPVYDAAPVIRQEVLTKNPEIADILNKLQGKISDEQMQELNLQVDVDGKEPADVAKDFLVSLGLY